MLRKERKTANVAAANSDLNKNDRKFCLDPKDVGEGWANIVPDKIRLTDERTYSYREVKGYALRDASGENQAQLLIVLFDYGGEGEAIAAFKEIGKGLESEMPKVPNIGDESVVYELELTPSIRMKIMAFRNGQWLCMFTLWLFKGYSIEDNSIKDIMNKQLNKVKDWKTS